MFNAASPLEIAALAAAVGWPLAAGVVLVVWSKVRAAQHARREAALEAELTALYRAVERQPVPERLAMVIEALEEAEAFRAAPAPPARRRTKAAATVG